MKADNWYALAVVNGREPSIRKRIIDRLERAKLSTPDMKFVCPDEEVVLGQGTPDRRVERRHTLPGYILVNSRRLSPATVNTIRRVNGVMGFLGGDESPTPLPRSEAEAMLGGGTPAGAGPAAGRPRGPSWEIGTLVTITDGPLSDFSGTITDVNEAQQTVTVDVAIFGRQTPASVPFASLRKG